MPSPALVATTEQLPGAKAVTLLPSIEQIVELLGLTAKETAPVPEPPLVDNVVVAGFVGSNTIVPLAGLTVRAVCEPLAILIVTVAVASE